ncbi:MAG: trypsin-like peptidase domain-containing protein [Clostridia bacterium]|nr:trypsin-like peptidase domain-containing protein [Clostridia bacterium]
MKKKGIFIVICVLIVLCATLTGCFTKDITEEVNLSNANFIFEKVVGKVLESTVTITCSTNSGTSGGAGVVVSSDGYVLTNYHVVQGATSIRVGFTDPNNPDNVKYEYADYIKELNDSSKYAKMDLALLKINSSLLGKSEFTPVKLKEKDVKYGEYGVVIGNPKQLGNLCAHAMVSHPSRTVNHTINSTIGKSKEVNLTTDFIIIDAPVNPGNSGGGFFDASGNLTGIVTMRQYDATSDNKNVVFGIGYAIPASSIKGYLARYKINI